MKNGVENGVDFEMNEITPVKKEKTLIDLKEERIKVLEERVNHLREMNDLQEQLIQNLKETNFKIKNNLL